MSTVRLRDDDSSTGTAIATVLIGAVAGFAVGVYLAQRLGGFSGIAGRLRRAGKDKDDAYYEAAGEDFPDTDEYEPAAWDDEDIAEHADEDAEHADTAFK